MRGPPDPSHASVVRGGLEAGLKIVPNRGTFATEDEALRFVVGRLVDALSPFAIYLFGSGTWGNARPDSDFDLLVVSGDDEPEDYERVYEPILGSGIGCDVVPVPHSVFVENVNDPTTLSYEAFHRGRKLYG